jgi:hypothetical protein
VIGKLLGAAKAILSAPPGTVTCRVLDWLPDEQGDVLVLCQTRRGDGSHAADITHLWVAAGAWRDVYFDVEVGDDVEFFPNTVLPAP